MRHHISSRADGQHESVSKDLARESARLYGALCVLGVFAVAPFLLKEGFTSRDCILVCAVGLLLLVFVAIDSVFGQRLDS